MTPISQGVERRIDERDEVGAREHVERLSRGHAGTMREHAALHPLEVIRIVDAASDGSAKEDRHAQRHGDHRPVCNPLDQSRAIVHRRGPESPPL